MNIELRRIQRLHSAIDNSLFMATGNLDYDRVTEAITRLANAVADYAGENEDWLYIGEHSGASVSDLIPGAYWHYTEWHGGQWSAGYAALSALGRVFSPGMTSGPEPESCEHDAYTALEAMAQAA